MTTVVLDTNVIVGAGFSPDSGASRIVAAVRDGRLRLVWDRTTRAETRSVVRRIPPLDWDDVADLYRRADEFDEPTDPDAFADAVDDPPDRRFAALALAAGAVLVSNDEGLLAADGVHGLHIISSGQMGADL